MVARRVYKVSGRLMNIKKKKNLMSPYFVCTANPDSPCMFHATAAAAVVGNAAKGPPPTTNNSTPTAYIDGWENDSIITQPVFRCEMTRSSEYVSAYEDTHSKPRFLVEYWSTVFDTVSR